MKTNKLLCSLALLYCFLSPAPALAHGEQVLPFFYTLGISFALSVVILTFKIEGKYKALLLLVYFLAVLSFVLILSPELSPNVIFTMFLSYPKSAGFLLNLIALVICFSLYSIMKRYHRKNGRARL